MKKNNLPLRIAGIAASAMLLAQAPAAFTIQADAATSKTTTVHGTVQSGTDAQTLYLHTSDGDMIIKLDSDTNASACKIMLQGSTVYAKVYYGSDAYMHASVLSSSEGGTVSSENTSTSTVTGTVLDKSVSDGIMYVKTSSGEMHIKLDASTDYSGCGVIYAGKGISMKVYRGDDAYMHAASISDYSAANTTASAAKVSAQTTTADTTSSTTQTSSNVSTTAVTGEVTGDVKDGKVKIKASDGTYELKFGSYTDYSNGFFLLDGKKVTANIYYDSSDAYMHVASFKHVGNRCASSDSSGSTAEFTGTVSSATSEGTLRLVTSGGTMEIRIDDNTSYSGSAPILDNSKVTVTCKICADEYWHATEIKLDD